MKKIKNNKAFSAVEIILVIAVVALIGAVGWIFYNNNNQNKSTSNSNSTNTTTPTKNYKEYKNDKYNISFSYPASWKIQNEKVDSGVISYLYLEVTDESNQLKARLKLFLFQGGWPETNATTDVLDLEKTSLSGDNGKSVYFVFRVSNVDSDGQPTNSETKSLRADAQLVTNYNKLGRTKWDGVYYFNSDDRRKDIPFQDTNNETKYWGGQISFEAFIPNFTNINEAKAYMQTDEYKEIKKMLLSLKLS